jgi:hypothetical protein
VRLVAIARGSCARHMLFLPLALADLAKAARPLGRSIRLSTKGNLNEGSTQVHYTLVLPERAVILVASRGQRKLAGVGLGRASRS